MALEAWTRKHAVDPIPCVQTEKPRRPNEWTDHTSQTRQSHEQLRTSRLYGMSVVKTKP